MVENFYMMNKKFKVSFLLISLFLILTNSISVFSETIKKDSLLKDQNKVDVYRKPDLTDVEKEWLKNHPIIKVGSDSNWAPFEFRDKNGNYNGINIEYLKLIAKKIGIKFEFTQDKTWNEILNSVQSKDIDMVSGVNETSLRSNYLNFTKPYYSTPISIFANSDITHIRNLNELKNKNVTVIKGYYIEEILRDKFPNINLILAKNPQEALKMLHKKEVFAYIESMVIASYYIKQKNYKSIRIVGDTPYKYNIRMGIRNDWPIFNEILQKTLETVSISEKNNIYHRWISFNSEQNSNHRVLYTFLVPLIIVLLIFIFWNRRLQLEVKKRKQTQDDLDIAFKKLQDTQTHLIQSEKMASIGFLTAGIAHEIKNPLNFISLGIKGIKNGIETILEITDNYERLYENDKSEKIKDLEKLKEKLDFDFYTKECVTLIDDVQYGVDNIEEITKSLNTLSYFSGDTKALTNVNQGIESTLVLLRNQYKYTIEIIKELGNIPEIKCFPGKLNQVFVNIISNAIHAIKNEGSIYIKTFVENNFLIISIKDSGTGIDNNSLEHIFDPFFTTKPIGEGTGLGLTISKNIISEHDGKIEVKSIKGKGTEFIISLPMLF